MPANTIPASQPVSQKDDALRRARTADQNRHRHAFTDATHHTGNPVAVATAYVLTGTASSGAAR